MEIKHTDTFILHKSQNKIYIYLQVSFSGERLRLSTGESLEDATFWDKETMQVKKDYKSSSNKTAKQINKTLINCSNAIEEVFTKYSILRKTLPTKTQVKNDYLKAIGKYTGRQRQTNDLSPTVEQGIREFIKAESEVRQWSLSIIKNFNNIINKINNFRKGLLLKELNEDILSDFAKWLIATNGGDLNNNTAKKRISQLKWFLRWCNRTGYYKNNLYETFQPKFKMVSGEKEIIFLTKGELQKWMSYKFSEKDNYLEKVRDVFLFCCFTGLRYSDVKNLKHADIRDGIIHIVTVKTADNILINLNDFSQAILDKYKDNDKTFALPVCASQVMNREIKQIGKLAGIDASVKKIYYKGNKRYEEVLPKYEYLSMHASRRTFVVTAMTLGMDTNVIMKFTGHNSINAMKPYMAVVDDMKKREMNKFNNLFDE